MDLEFVVDTGAARLLEQGEDEAFAWSVSGDEILGAAPESAVVSNVHAQRKALEQWRLLKKRQALHAVDGNTGGGSSVGNHLDKKNKTMEVEVMSSPVAMINSKEKEEILGPLASSPFPDWPVAAVSTGSAENILETPNDIAANIGDDMVALGSGNYPVEVANDDDDATMLELKPQRNPEDFDPAALLLVNDILVQELADLRNRSSNEMLALREERDLIRLELDSRDAKFTIQARRLKDSLEAGLFASMEHIEALTKELNSAKEEIARLKKR